MGIAERLTWRGLAPGIDAYADAGPVTCKSVAVTTASTAILANGDLLYPGRAQITLNNSGPNVEFCQFGTSNACTVANGFMLLIGETLTFGTQPTLGNKVAQPPQSDLCCIGFNGGGNTIANTQVCEW